MVILRLGKMKDFEKSKEELIRELDELRTAFNLLKCSYDTESSRAIRAVHIRKEAEEVLNKEPGKKVPPVIKADASQLAHELQVHKIELEMQNEELLLANKRLVSANKKYTDLYEFAPSGYFSLSKEGNILGLNLSGSTILGIERTQLRNKSFAFFVSKETRPVFILFLAKLFASRTNESCEIRLSSEDDFPKYLHISGIAAENEEVCHLTVIDITEHQRNLEDLHQSEARYKALFRKNISVMLLIHPETGEIFDANPSACQFYGWSHEEICRMNISEINTLSTEEVKLELQKAIEDQRSQFYFKHRKANGEVRNVEVYTGPIKVGETTLLYSIVHDITEQTKAEKLLRESSQKWEALISTSPDGIGIASLDGKMQVISEKLAMMFGYSLEEKDTNIGRPAFDFIDPEYHEILAGNIRDLVSGVSNYKITEYMAVKKDKSRFYAELYSTLLRDASGKPASILYIERDITLRKQAEDALRKNEELLNAIVETAKDSIFIKNTSLQYIKVNEAMESLFGMTQEDMLGKTDTDLFGPENAGHIEEIDRQVLEGKTIEEFPSKPVNGELKHFHTIKVPLKDAKGLITGLCGIARDITDNKIAETNLRISEEKYRNIFESMQDVYYEASLEGTILELSPSIKDFTKGQLTREELLGKSLLGYYTDPDDRNTFYTELSKHGTVRDYELSMHNKDGSIVPVSISSTVLPGADGKPEKISGTMRDITERKLADLAIQDLNKTLEQKVEERTLQLSEVNKSLLKGIEEKAQITVALEIKTKELENFFNVSPDLLCIIDSSGTFVKVNKAWEITLGYTEEELINKPFLEFIHPEDLQPALENLRNHDRLPNVIYRYCAKTGNYRFLEWNGVQAGDQFYGAARDITDRKKAEADLKQLSTRLTLAARAGGVGVWDYDIVNNILVWDKQMYTLYGIEEKDFSGAYDAWQAGLHPDDAARGDEEIQMAIKGEKEFDTEFRVVWPDGEIRHIRAYAIVYRDKDGKASHMIGTNWEITSLKQAETLLEQTRLNYETFFNTIDDFLFVLDEQGRIIHTNTTVNSRLGYSQKDLFDQSVLMVHPSERREEAGRIVGEMLAGTADFCPVPLISKTGLYIPVETRVKTGFWDRKPVIFGVSKDISKIKLSEEKFSKAFQSNSSLMAISALDGKLIEVNNAFLNTLGYTREEVIGITTHKLGIFADPALRNTLIEQLMHNVPVREIELEMSKKDGSLMTGLFSAETIYIGADLCLLTMLIDITERKQNQVALQSNLAILEATKNAAYDGILVIDKSKENVLVMSKKFIDMFKVPMDIAVNKKVPALLQHMLTMVKHPDEFIKKLNFFYDHPIETGRDEIELNDGIIVERYTAQVEGINEESQGRIWTWRDITQSKHAEKEIIKSRNEAVKANLAKSEFLSRMSHELRTPMNSILGFAQLMKMGELSAAHKKGVNHILKSGSHLLYLINEVLDISRIEAGRLTLSLEPVLVKSVIVEMLDFVQQDAAKKDLTVEMEQSPGNELSVKADRQRLKQVLINLINNAVKYNSQGGRVIIRTELKDGSGQGMPSIRISVSDNGPGIKPEDMEKLFLPFERIGAEKSEIEGTGLGLMVAKKLMDAMGGLVGVDSSPGQGSTFWIELPQAESQKTTNARTRDASSAEILTTANAGTVLYIEDNLANAELVEEILRDHRPAINIITTGSGKSGVQIAKDSKPDLILLDLDLPDLYGSKVLEILKSDPATSIIPVVIITADAMPQQVENLMMSGAKDYLTKPLDIVGFLQMIDEWIEK